MRPFSNELSDKNKGFLLPMRLGLNLEHLRHFGVYLRGDRSLAGKIKSHRNRTDFCLEGALRGVVSSSNLVRVIELR